PGLNYRGINADQLIKKLSNNQKLLLAASEEDEYSFQSILDLVELSQVETEIIRLKQVGHGTTMLDKSPKFFNEIIDYITKIYEN
ncbi:MAG: hypothetical protein ACE5DR_03560, partial [Thermodesulfobacteriota bacterium]